MTRFAILSDTHGNIRGLASALSAIEEVSGLIHLGDGVADGQKVAEERGLQFWGVRGNEDRMNGWPEKTVLKTNGWSILLLHGHQWEINPYQSKEDWDANLDDLARTAQAARTDGLFFGHTHRPHLERRKGALLLNPGNLYIGSIRENTFAALEAAPGLLTIEILENAGGGQWRVRRKTRFKKQEFTLGGVSNE